MGILPANIEEIKPSIINHNVRFNNGFETMRDLIDFRRANLKTTAMLWITLSPVIDHGYSVYNPKALIFRILN